jgi:hypothetical protein
LNLASPDESTFKLPEKAAVLFAAVFSGQNHALN